MMKRLAGALCWLATAAVPLLAAAQTPPPGWRGPAAAGDGEQVYAPVAPGPGQHTAVTIHPRVPLQGQALERWLADRLATDPAPPGGTWLGTPTPRRDASQVASANRAWRDTSGSQGVAVYLAMSPDGRRVRLARWTANSEATAKRYAVPAQSITTQLAEIEKRAAGNAPVPALPAAKSTGAEADAKAVAKVESSPPAVRDAGDRYPHVTAPGQGISAAQIETVLYQFKQIYTVTGLQMLEWVYLLLKDGTVQEGLPVAPADLDVARSRAAEPKKWGRWRREGGGYALAWPDKPNEFERVQGIVLRPGRPGSTVTGRWRASSSYSIPGGASVWGTWAVHLKGDGRFEQTRFGGGSAGGSGGDAQVSTVYDEKGAVVSSSGRGFAIGSESRTADRGDHSGRYEIDGHTITLQYDDGRVVRQAYAMDAQRKTLWWKGSLLDAF